MPEDVQQDLGGHDPDILLGQLLGPSAPVPVVHIHVATVVCHPEVGVLAQHLCLLHEQQGLLTLFFTTAVN